ncbi:MAG: hypothetical protein D6814_14900, partial [Calditrichaeota bacterium]
MCHNQALECPNVSPVRAHIFKAVFMAAILFVFLISELFAQSPAPYVPHQVIVKFKTGILSGEIYRLRKTLKLSQFKRFNLIGAELWQLPEMSTAEAIAQLRNDPRVEYVEPNYRVSIDQTTPDDPGFSRQWALNNLQQTGGSIDADIDAVEAWDLQANTDIVIGIIDTGVDWQHEDLAANIWTNPGEIPNNGIDDDQNGYIDDVRGWDFFNHDNDPMDDNGHGTHVAGIIAAQGNNGIGVSGVCWSARIMPLKFLDNSGSGTSAEAILALEYAIKMGAKITNNSWGGVDDADSRALQEAIAASARANMLFIAAAGNGGSNNDTSPRFPSSYELDNIISVASTDHNDLKSPFSNFGPKSVDLAAPGSNIYSTLPGNKYGALFGTSMAAPHVTGVAALIWAHEPGLSYQQVKRKILASVDPLPTLAKTVSGGRLNAFNALAESDIISPAAIMDLSVTDSSSNSITLSWTATGDDSIEGTANQYVLRYADFPVEEGNFDSAREVRDLPRPRKSGARESVTVTGLDFQTRYYFAIKALDEWGNASPLSNTVSATTLAAPDIAVSPTQFNQNLKAGQTTTQVLKIQNLSSGTLSFNLSIQEQTASRSLSSRQSPGGPAIQSKNNPLGASNGPGTIPTADKPIQAVVLDGIGTYSAKDRLWDDLNTNWAQYGDEEIQIDYTTFHGVEITYQSLVASGAEVLIISNNWNPTHPYGPFTEAEAAAIARYVGEGAGLIITGGTFNNGEFPALQTQVRVLAPLVGLNPTATYFWNGNTYGALNFKQPESGLLRNVAEPYQSGWAEKTLVPASGVWDSTAILNGKLVAVSDNAQTALVSYKNRVFHSSLPEHLTGNSSDRQFVYNAIRFAAARSGWLSVTPLQGLLRGPSSQEI